MMMERNVMAYPKKKWSHINDSRAVLSEDSLQKFANEYLDLRKVDYFRIEDGFFRWVKMKASMHIQKWFFGMFGGRPDNTCIIPIGKYSLALNLELKSKTGRLHGKQKTNSRNQPWHVCRSPEAVQEVVEQFIRDAELLSSAIEKHGGILNVVEKC